MTQIWQHPRTSGYWPELYGSLQNTDLSLSQPCSLDLPTSTSHSGSTTVPSLSKLLDSIYSLIRVYSDDSDEQLLRRVETLLKAAFTSQKNKMPKLDTSFEVWVAYVEILLVDHLVTVDQPGLALRILTTKVPLIDDSTIQVVFHMRITALCLDLDQVDLALSYHAEACSLGIEHLAIQQEIWLSTARLYFHQCRFHHAYDAFTHLQSKVACEPSLDFITSMRTLSALLVSPHTQSKLLLDIKSSNLQTKLPSLNSLVERMQSHQPLLPNTRAFTQLASLLPPRLNSNGTFSQITQEYNLWSSSLKSDSLSSHKLGALLDASDVKFSQNEWKASGQDMVMQGRLNTQVDSTSDSERVVGSQETATFGTQPLVIKNPSGPPAIPPTFTHHISPSDDSSSSELDEAEKQLIASLALFSKTVRAYQNL